MGPVQATISLHVRTATRMECPYLQIYDPQQEKSLAPLEILKFIYVTHL